MYSFPEFVLDVATLANSIEGPLTVFGHSLGGAIALQYAGTFPEKVDRVLHVWLGRESEAYEIRQDQPEVTRERAHPSPPIPARANESAQ